MIMEKEKNVSFSKRLKTSLFVAGIISSTLALQVNAQTDPNNPNNIRPRTAGENTAITTASSDNNKLAHADSSFIKEAAHGGMMEVKMGQLAVDKSQNAQVKEFG